MIQPSEPERTWLLGRHETGIRVVYFVFLRYAEGAEDTLQVKSVLSLLLFDMCRLCLAPVEKYAYVTGVVDCHLCLDGERRVLQPSRGEASECAFSFPKLFLRPG